MRQSLLLTGLLCGLILGFGSGCTDYRINDEYYTNPAYLSAEALAEVPEHRLCEAYAHNRDPRVRAELKRRDTFSELEWQAIDGRQVLMGIGEMALMTALADIKCTDTFRSNGVITKEWHYARVTALRVRTENGKVVWFR